MLLRLPSSQWDKQENKKGWLSECGWSRFLGLRVESDPCSPFFWEGEEMVEFTTNGYFSSCRIISIHSPTPICFSFSVFKCNLESFSQREVLKFCMVSGDGMGKKISQSDFFLLFRTVSLAVWRSLAFHGLFNILLSTCSKMLYRLEIAPAVTLNASNIALVLARSGCTFHFLESKSRKNLWKNRGLELLYDCKETAPSPMRPENSPKYKVGLKTTRR